MRLAAKMMLWGFCAAPAAAAMVLTGAGAANAAAAAPAAHSAATYNPWGPGPHCSWWERERWNVNGYNTVKLVFSSTTYTYTVNFKQNGSCLGGTLTDTYLPGSPSLQISGIDRQPRHHVQRHLSPGRPGNTDLHGNYLPARRRVRELERDGQRARHRALVPGSRRGSRLLPLLLVGPAA